MFRLILGLTLIINAFGCFSQRPIGHAGSASESPVSVASLDNEERHLDTCATFYFNNLRQNFGTNIHNSCGFVAMSSLLSFYDSYWNDSIIERKFEKNANIPDGYSNLNKLYASGEYSESPGIYDDSYAMEGLSEDLAYHQVSKYANSDYLFQFHLIKEFYDFTDGYYLEQFYSKLDFTIYDLPLSNYLNHYLKGVLGTDKQKYVSFKSNKEMSLDSLIEEIKNGRPALVLLNNEFEEGSPYYRGHFTIAYDYDSSKSNKEDGIIFHTGWDGGYAVTFSDMKNLGYTNIYSYSVIDFDSITHSCSDNYLRSSKSFCLCNIGVHPAHAHYSTNGSAYDYGSDTYHWRCCNICSKWYAQSHTLTGTINNGWWCHYCPECGYLKQIHEIP